MRKTQKCERSSTVSGVGVGPPVTFAFNETATCECHHIDDIPLRCTIYSYCREGRKSGNSTPLATKTLLCAKWELYECTWTSLQPTLLSAHISYSVTPLPHSALRTHGFIFEPDVFVIRRRASIALEGDRPVIGNVKLGSDRQTLRHRP